MDIKNIHIFFIVCATLISVFFGIWSFRYAIAQEMIAYNFLSMFSFLMAGGLVVYGIKFF